MGDLGLDMAYGAQGSSDAMQQIFERRMALAASQRQQQQLEQNDALTRLKIQEHADEIRQNLEGKRQAEKDRVEASKAAEQDRQDKQAASTFTMNPVGANLGPTQGPRAQQLGFPVSQIAGPKVQQTTGFMPLPSAPPQGPGMQAMGDLSPVGGPSAGPQVAPGASTTAQTQMPDTFQRGATQADVVQQQGAADKVEAARLAAENRTSDNEQRAKDRLAQIAAAAAARPVPDKLTKVEHKDPVTGRTVIEWKPQSELRGQTFEKGVSGATETRLQSAQAVQQTGEDIIKQVSDPAMAKNLGPVLGRFTKLSDFIGDPPPEYSELAGAIESYALASMGVHGMRSSVGAEKIKNLLDGHHTPESLASTIRGLSKFSQHFMENEGRSPSTPAATTGAPPAPDGWKYVPKPGGGWTAVKATP